MNENEKTCLGRFYFLLQGNLKREGSLKENSVLISFLRTRSAVRYSLLRKSTINSASIPNQILVSLLTEGLIQSIENIDTYAVTAKGVWYYEQSLGVINEKSLLSYINEMYFVPKMNNDMDDKEKVILLTMISARVFSEKSSVDLKKSDAVKDKWQEILKRSYDVLYKMGSLSKVNKEDFLVGGGNLHIVSSIFRHNNKMIQRTKEIYAFNKKEEYYLDLFRNEIFSREKLSYLFWKIFKGDISRDSVNQIIDYCNEVSSKESIYLFDMKEHAFSTPAYDIMLKDGLMGSIMSKDKWSKIS
jgi:hypothetical protein